LGNREKSKRLRELLTEEAGLVAFLETCDLKFAHSVSTLPPEASVNGKQDSPSDRKASVLIDQALSLSTEQPYSLR
jgi:hypothetical protein